MAGVLQQAEVEELHLYVELLVTASDDAGTPQSVLGKRLSARARYASLLLQGTAEQSHLQYARHYLACLGDFLVHWPHLSLLLRHGCPRSRDPRDTADIS